VYTNTLIRNVEQISRTPETDLEQMWLCINSVLWGKKKIIVPAYQFHITFLVGYLTMCQQLHHIASNARICE
jgi:hypothetical protein